MRAWRITVALFALVALGAVLTPAAQAGSPVYNFEVVPSTTQAGGHPDLQIAIEFGNRSSQHIPPPSCDCQDPRDFELHLPTGIIGDPHATPQCSQADFGSGVCPPSSQVGTAAFGLGTAAIYNVQPSPAQAGLLAFATPALGSPIYLVIEPRTGGDYGLDGVARGINHFLPLSFIDLEFWGVPASPIHTPERNRPAPCDPFYPPGCGGEPSSAPLLPFLDNPTTCGETLTATIDVRSYDKEVTHGYSPYPQTTGCNQLTFNPSLYAQPTTKATDSASGLDVDLRVPQTSSPTVPSPSEIKESVVTLPAGFSINPNAADGKLACSSTEANFGSTAAAECPQDAKVGSLTIESSALPGPLPGYIYLGQPLPGDRYRIFLVADGYAVHVKLLGDVSLNPQTGQIVVAFKNLPQTPFSDFDLHFFGSERSLFSNPIKCGTYPVETSFVPWDGVLASQSSTQYFELTSGPGGAACPGPVRPYAPTLRAGVASKTGGAHSPFTLEVTRPDGDQTFNTIQATVPPGLLADVGGIPYCPDATLTSLAEPSALGVAELGSPACPVASQIGTSDTGAGAGDHPVYLPGRVFLAGPYKGAPLSLAVITPAVSGPYDLGNVVVRAALNLDPTSAQITATSDPLPTILQGIPLRLRYIRIALDRPNFTINPTDCQPFAVKAALTGGEGATATPSVHYQAADCTDLPFNPKLSLDLSGATKRAGSPGLKATLIQPKAPYANFSRVQVALPHSEFLNQAHIKTICTRVQFAAHNCPAGSVYGHATAVSPLLGYPLSGPVYLRSSNHKLPDLVVALHGPASQPIEIDLDGRIDSVNGGIRTTFESIPDAAVSKFVLTLEKGKKSLLSNSVDICKEGGNASVQMTAQNGRKLHTETPLTAPCKSTKEKAKK
jgi:hypothetical protein